MKENCPRNPIILWLLSLASILLLPGFLFLRWPFELPGAVVSRLWFSNVLEPVLRSLSSPGSSFMTALPASIAWWPCALGIALLLPVLSGIGKPDRRSWKWSFLVVLTLCLADLCVADVFYATNLHDLHPPLAIVLGWGIGISLIGIALPVIEGGPLSLSRRLARTIRILLISAGIGIGSFVLLPLGSLAFALALAAIAFAYAQAALASLRLDRVGQQSLGRNPE